MPTGRQRDNSGRDRATGADIDGGRRGLPTDDVVLLAFVIPNANRAPRIVLQVIERHADGDHIPRRAVFFIAEGTRRRNIYH